MVSFPIEFEFPTTRPALASLRTVPVTLTGFLAPYFTISPFYNELISLEVQPSCFQYVYISSESFVYVFENTQTS